MNTFKKLFIALVAAGSLGCAISAHATVFTVSASLAGGTGYGVDNVDPTSENGSSTLLDVLFTNLGIPQNFTLTAANPSSTFNVATVNFRETDLGNSQGAGINDKETNLLSVIATFIFSSPISGNQLITATGTATQGPIGDTDVDYTLNWDPIFVNFGSGGQFKIDLLDLSYSNVGIQTETATITLLALPSASNVPEPATLALLGLGFAGLGFSRRKRSA